MAGSQRTLRAAVDNADTIRLSRLPFHEQIELLFFCQSVLRDLSGQRSKATSSVCAQRTDKPLCCTNKKHAFSALIVDICIVPQNVSPMFVITYLSYLWPLAQSYCKHVVTKTAHGTYLS